MVTDAARDRAFRAVLSHHVLMFAESIRATEEMARRHGGALLGSAAESDFLERMIQTATVEGEPAAADLAELHKLFKRAGKSPFVSSISVRRLRELIERSEAIARWSSEEQQATGTSDNHSWPGIVAVRHRTRSAVNAAAAGPAAPQEEGASPSPGGPPPIKVRHRARVVPSTEVPPPGSGNAR